MLYEEDKQRVFLVTWSTDKKNTIPWVLVTVYWSPTALLFWYLLVSDWKSKMCKLERSDWRLAYKTGGWIGRLSLNDLGFHPDKYYKHQTVKLIAFVTDPFKLWVELSLRGCVAWPPTLRDPRDHKVSPGIIYGMRVVSSDRLEREGNYKTHPQEIKMWP